jgi:hypothetical protein
MTLRKLATVLPVVAVLALTGPVAGASAQTDSGSTGTPSSPGSSIPCYPFPAWCGPSGQPLTPWPFTFQLPSALLAQLGWHFPSATATPAPMP